MKRSGLYNLDYSASFLSAFDIGGSLLLMNAALHSKGVEHDINQLIKDQNIIEEDYRSAYENILKEEENK
jgi:hypothetical protein